LKPIQGGTVVNVPDESALDRAYSHRRSIRAFLKVERRARGQIAAAPRQKALAIGPERLGEILAILVSTFPPCARPPIREIARVARCTRDAASEARRLAIKAGTWPFGNGS
jgi:hypothetical protein